MEGVCPGGHVRRGGLQWAMPGDNIPRGSSGRDLIARGDALGGHATSKHLDRPAGELHKGFAKASPSTKVMSKAASKRDHFKAANMMRNSGEYRSAVQQLRAAPPGSFATIRILVPSGDAPRTQMVTRAAPNTVRAMASDTIFAKVVKNPKGLFFQTLVTEPKPTPGSPSRPPGVKITLARTHGPGKR